MRKYGIDKHWSFGWISKENYNYYKEASGEVVLEKPDCFYYMGLTVFDDHCIYLSRPLTERNSPTIVKNTILHEIAHVMTEKEKPEHGPLWKKKCLELGGNGRAHCTEVLMPRKENSYIDFNHE